MTYSPHVMPRLLCLLLACLLGGLPGCRRPPEDAVAAGPKGPASAPPEAPLPEGVALIPTPFSDIYQLFLMPQIPSNVKSARWNTEFKDRWVRWTGKLITVGGGSAKFKQLQPTVTFDVSMLLNRQAQNRGPALRPGQFYTYVGRLRSYDDLFRTLYLDQGVVLPAGQSTGTLVPIPPPLRFAPGAP